MSDSTKGLENCTASEIEENIKRREDYLKMNKDNKSSVELIEQMEKDLDHLRVYLIFKKQEEKAEMKQLEEKAEIKRLLSRLLQMVESL